MRPRDTVRGQELENRLILHHQDVRELPGISDPSARTAFVEQLLESLHRIQYVAVVSERDISPRRADPNDELFDPLKAAIFQKRDGNFEEAFWLTFLFVHFGKNARGGWRFAREVYGRLGAPQRWDWAATSADPIGFRSWLDWHQAHIKRAGVAGGFGNHRKYESLDAGSPGGTGAVVQSYVKWVNPPRSHQQLIVDAVQGAHGDRRLTFDYLFRSMETVTHFGRTARFDYLTMLGKIGLAPVEPGSVYIQNSTGPEKGARLLFGVPEAAQASRKTLDKWLVELEGTLNVGMQAVEDAICNWQKNPNRFVAFRG